MKKIILLLLISVFVLGACNKDDNVSADTAEQLLIDIEEIQAVLEQNGLTAQSTNSGLHYIIEIEGNDIYPTLSSAIEIEYVGKFLNGDVFDSGTLEDFPLSSLILGWQEGLQFFSEGAVGKLFVPSGLAYGSDDYYDIPGNSVLIFEITLISVTN